MTVCNMSIEAGARAGMIAVDDKTIEYLRGRPFAPSAEHWDRAVAYWRTLASDEGARFDTVVVLDAPTLSPQVTWGTSPEMVVPIDGRVPDPDKEKDAGRRDGIERALVYMGLTPNTPMTDIGIDKVFIGSCTNSRIEDLRAAAWVARGRRVASSVKLAMVVPGSGLVKAQAEREGLDKVFRDAGFDWREPGLLDVPRDERRPARARRALRVDVEPQFRGAAGHRGPHAPRQPGDGGRRGDRRPFRRRASTRLGPFTPDEGASHAEPMLAVGHTACCLAPRWPDATRSKAPARTSRPPAAPSRRRRSQRSPTEPPWNLSVRHTGLVAPLDRANVDTDAIIPKQFLKSIKRSGFGPNLFDAWRYLDRGEPGMDNAKRPRNPDFVLNEPRYQGASILLARRNFGCGSSREHAPWALADYGFRAVIAPSYADIFFNNCFKNGFLPIVLPESQVDRLFDAVKAFPGFRLVDRSRAARRSRAGRRDGVQLRRRHLPQALPRQRPRRHRAHAAARGRDPRVRGEAARRPAVARVAVLP